MTAVEWLNISVLVLLTLLGVGAIPWAITVERKLATLVSRGTVDPKKFAVLQSRITRELGDDQTDGKVSQRLDKIETRVASVENALK